MNGQAFSSCPIPGMSARRASWRRSASTPWPPPARDSLSPWGGVTAKVRVSRDETLANARAIVEATDLPVSADLENGFGDAPKTCAETIRQASATGLAGGSIEDATGDLSRPIYDFHQAVERIAAAAEAASSLPFVLTARAENFLHGRPDLDDTIRRLQAYAKAGAEVLFAPGLKNLESIRTVCAAVGKPVNVLVGLSGATFTVDELAAAGAKRISVGGALARAALGGFLRAAREIKERGAFTFSAEAMPFSEASSYMATIPVRHSRT